MNCPVCNTPVPAGQQFCPACGTHVGAGAPAAGGFQNQGASLSGTSGSSDEYKTWFKVVAWIGLAVSVCLVFFWIMNFSNPMARFITNMYMPFTIGLLGSCATSVGFLLMGLQKLDWKKQMLIVGIGWLLCCIAVFIMQNFERGGLSMWMAEAAILCIIPTVMPLTALIGLLTGKAFD